MPHANDVPASQRLGQVIASVLFCFLTAGVVFGTCSRRVCSISQGLTSIVSGYAALKPVLLASNVYPDLSKQERDTRLNLMFTLATTVTNVGCTEGGTVESELTAPNRPGRSAACRFSTRCVWPAEDDHRRSTGVCARKHSVRIANRTRR